MGQSWHCMSRGLSFFLRKMNFKSSGLNRILAHQGITLAVKRVEFVSDRVLYTVVRVRWCNIIVLNMHAQSDGKSDGLKDSFMNN